MILSMDNQTNQNQTQQFTNFQQSSFSSKIKFFLSQHKFIIIFVAIIFFLSFGTTGYLLVANQKISISNEVTNTNVVSSPAPVSKSAEITEQPIPTTIPTPTIALEIDQTASWSAFSSSKYSYSIKHPPNWTAKITSQTDSKILEYVVFNPVATKAGTLSITLSYGTRTYTQALALNSQIGESLIVASVSATKKNSKDSNGYKATNVIVPFGVNTIIFNAKDAYADIFNQMLPTLKLTR